jgi:hypothetical protein
LGELTWVSVTEPIKKRKSGIPTGNAGEYLVMGELLRRGYDAQLADRNTKGYDLLVGSSGKSSLRKVQVKSVRTPPWYVRVSSFTDTPQQVTVYVLLGSLEATKPVRYFVVRNRRLKDYVHCPAGWSENAFMSLAAVEQHENKWEALGRLSASG